MHQVFPARAGMIRFNTMLEAQNFGIPRESGDDPSIASWRSWRRSVFPARAGMIPRQPSPRQNSYCIPRESGDDPARGPGQNQGVRYSPRERG